ncbi:MAG: hypothetical protein EFKGCFLK_01231 [Rhodocyclaceae bacterium]|nr:MAG: ribonuclease [Rhodocyclaceae bacterium]MBE7424045.1 ribonuclease [Zoogloeaceae bacterium]MBV6407664.1 hypothetical protein [Rhodocyclaceae bacterium]MCK6383360.1 ribonuclease [Rhodocyclaceae bacterium]
MIGKVQSALGLILLLLACPHARSDAQTHAHAPAPSLQQVPAAELPPDARITLTLIKRGGPFPYRRDGAIFGNHERLLPVKPRAHYFEYTVRTPEARDRGARRIVAGRGTTGDVRTSGEYYYTADHYRSFRKIQE